MDNLKAERDVAFVARRCAGRGKKVYEKYGHARGQCEVEFRNSASLIQGRYANTIANSARLGSPVLLTLCSRVSIHNRVRLRMSLGHRVSRETLCPLGQPEKTIGQESPIEPWLALHNHSACCFSEPKASSHITMNLRNSKITAPHCHMGWMTERSPVAEEAFLLTSPFIERGYR